MTKRSDPPAAGNPVHAALRRDRAQGLRRRITTAVAATGAGTVAAFGVLAAGHNAGTAVVTIATAAKTNPTVAATSSASATSSSSSSSAATATPTIAAATAAPTAAAAPTAQAVTGGSGG
jgi:hypothetical protein